VLYITKAVVADATGNSVTTLLNEVVAKRFSRGISSKCSVSLQTHAVPVSDVEYRITFIKNILINCKLGSFLI
jgi:hypothetical protein